MDVKDLRTDHALGERNNDGINFTANSSATSCNRNKPCQDITSNQLGKVDVPSRPCAVIGPDRVLPPLVSNDFKKGPYEPWPYTENTYHFPPEYPHKTSNYQTPLRNISPRQTFQENMQRIMVPPSYNSMRVNEESNFSLDRNISQLKNVKTNIPVDTKYCDVPYTINNDQISVKNSDLRVSNVNPVLAQSAPNGWPPNMRASKPYSGPELYQYHEYGSSAGPRPMPMSRPHRSVHEDPGLMYADSYGCDGSNRYKPYPTVKERYPQARYEYIGNYSNPFHPAPFPPNKYDLQKSLPPPYSSYPQIPIKYFDGRIPEPVMDGYQRVNQQGNYNLPIRNQIIHPTYGPMLGNSIQNNIYPLPPEGSVKTVSGNKLPYDNTKIYVDYVDSSRPKTYPHPPPENFYVNEVPRLHHPKNQVIPNYPPVNMHALPHPYYRKENVTLKNYEYMTQFRNIEPSMSRFPSQISPNSVAISPSDSNTSNDTTQTHMNSQEDCGYVSQSPTTSIRSMELSMNRIPNDFYRRYDPRYGHTTRPAMMSKPELNSVANSKEKKGIDVRQFLQMWNEGDDENNENSNKEITNQQHTNIGTKMPVHKEHTKNHDQLYVLGLVNVPREDLSKYEHIQKVSKLPENIKGYNNIELLNQFEEAIESSNINNFKVKHSSMDNPYQIPMKGSMSHQVTGTRSVSPLDVEAKISQSVIHKEVGCNFEIKPCSPQMLNVEIATPAQTILGERVIEKLSNPLILTPPNLNNLEENNKNIDMNHSTIESQANITSNKDIKIPSCKMASTQFVSNDSIEAEKSNYSLQDLESNSSISLASLPRLDNDIELNFPEVNQQFINANKGETVITTAKDLPSLAVNNTENILKHSKDSLQCEPEIIAQCSPIIETEREFAKLSRYRKIKRNCSEANGKKVQPCLQTVRTDSVIIKNPDNPRIYENNKDTLSPINKLTENLQIHPVNLSPNCRSPSNKVNENVNNDNLNKEKHPSVEIAIDFSVSKSKNCGKPINPATTNIFQGIQTSPIVNSLYNSDTEFDTHSSISIESDSKKLKLKENNQEEDKIKSLSEIVPNNYPSLIKKFHYEPTSGIEIFDETKYSNVDNTVKNEHVSENSNSKNNSETKTKLEVEESVNVNNSTTIPILSSKNTINDNDKLNISNAISPYRLENQNEIGLENQTDSIKLDPDDTILHRIPITVDLVSDPVGSIENISSDDYSMKNSHSLQNTSENIELNNLISNDINDSLGSNIEEVLPEITNQTVSELDIANIFQQNSPENVLNKSPCDQTNEIGVQNGSTLNDQNYSLNSNLIDKSMDQTISSLEDTKPINIESNLSTNSVIQTQTIGEKQKDDCFKDLQTKLENTNIEKNTTNLENSDTSYDETLNNMVIINPKKYCDDKDKVRVILPLSSVDKTMWENATKSSKEDSKEIAASDDNFVDTSEIILDSKPNSTSEIVIINEGDSDAIESTILSPQETCKENLSKCNKKYFGLIEYSLGSENLKNSGKRCLKRSLSDSALDRFKEDCSDDFQINWQSKRRKKHLHHLIEPPIIEDNFCSIQTIRRNSISSIYNEENVSFCILIDNNCIITQDDEQEKVCITEMSENVDTDDNFNNEYEAINSQTKVEILLEEDKLIEENNELKCNFSECTSLENLDESFEEPWVDDVACVETVVSDDIAEDIIISTPSTPREINSSDNDDSEMFINNRHTDKVKYIYGDKMCNDDAQFVETLYRTPQMDVNKTLINREYLYGTEGINKCYDKDSLEKILSESNQGEYQTYLTVPYTIPSENIKNTCDKENLNTDNMTLSKNISEIETKRIDEANVENVLNIQMQDDTKHSCESSLDNVFNYIEKENKKYKTSSSPEVSSTTSEEKSASVMLNITDYEVSRLSQYTDVDAESHDKQISSKYIEDPVHHKSGDLRSLPRSRPLITKAAQKYIPPLKETFNDLKIKLPLPKHSLMKLKQLKILKNEPKINKQSNFKKEVPKKPKPKFEEVLKSIDEIQFKMHKEKSKKVKKSIPKVVIKKNENGSHYASTPNKRSFNPDLTGRKWQPWVFLEKNNFIDKMALKRKTKAVFSYRKNAYVFAEKFQKYKSIESAKFVISQPKLDESTLGPLKCTIRLKHTY
ncbi:LOW QUALITY PROTEIN: uncharacterized protein ACR2FA_011153 [Aphomia sociella]